MADRHTDAIKYFFMLTLLIVALATCPASASAQDAESNLPAESDTQFADTMIVTARKIPEPLLRSPFSISTFSQEDVEQLRILSIDELLLQSPGLSMENGGDRYVAPVAIRGVGSFTDFSFENPSVSTYIDDIPLPFRMANQRYTDVVGIEVLRGPQSVTFGRGAQAGAIRLITEDPSDTLSGRFGLEVGGQQHVRVRGSLSGPVNDTLALLGSLEYGDRDGDIDNILSGNENVRGEDYISGTFKSLWEPTNDLDITFSVRFEDGSLNTPNAILKDNDFDRQATDGTDVNDRQLKTYSLVAEYGLSENWTLKSLTGFSTYNFDYNFDLTDDLVLSTAFGVPSGSFVNPEIDRVTIFQDSDQFSQEFQAIGAFGDVKILSGLFFLDASTDASRLASPGSFNPNETLQRNSVDVSAYSAFLEATIPVAERLTLIAGARGNWEESEAKGFFSNNGSVIDEVDDDIDSSQVDFRLGANYALTDNLAIYGSFARGSRAAAFPTFLYAIGFGLPQPRLEASETDAFEIGLRGVFFDGALTFGLAAYIQETSDENVFSVVDFASSVAENLDTEGQGIEAEISLSFTEKTSISGAFSYNDSEVTSLSRKPSPSGAFEGARLPFVPETTAALTAQTGWDFNIGTTAAETVLTAQYQYFGDRFTTAGNTLKLDSYDLVNVRAAINVDNISYYIFASNLFDERYATRAFEFGNAISAVPGAFRQIGVGVEVTF